jgi:hypothetical protein
MLNSKQLREFIIKPALDDLLLYSADAEELLVFTCAVESVGGTYLKQLDGPALGIYQMEPVTYNDIWQNYIREKQSLCMKIAMNFNAFFIPDEGRLVYDLRFATMMCRVHYSRVQEVLPNKDDHLAVWNYYKRYYNSALGAATQNESIQKYLTFTKP